MACHSCSGMRVSAVGSWRRIMPLNRATSKNRPKVGNALLVPLAGTVDDRHGGPGLPFQDGARCDVRVLPAGNGGALVHEVLHCDPPPAEVLIGLGVEDDLLADAAIIDPSERDAASSGCVDGVPLELHTGNHRQGLVDGRLHTFEWGAEWGRTVPSAG